MANQNLIDYIKESKEKGISGEEIKKALLEAGWKEEDVDAAFKPPIPSPEPSVPFKISSEMQHLHPLAVWLFFLRYIWSFVGAGFIIGMIAGSVIVEEIIKGEGVGVSARWWVLIVIVVLILVIALCYLWAKLSYRFWKYQLTGDVYKAERGVIYKRYISIPYERIQNVDIYRGILDRILGLSDLQIQTAGYGASGHRGKRGFGSEGRLPGLEKQKAETMREELIKRAKGKGQGL